MKWTVVWQPEAERRLAELWMNSNDRMAITQASHALDQALRRSPEIVGESRDMGRRILLVPPLAVIYTFQPEDRLVKVISVWQFTPPNA